MNEIRIENWEFIFRNADPYQAPECVPVHMQGEVHGHPRFEDGEAITTTQIIATDGRYVKTNNNWYLLGKPSDRYASWCKKNYPNSDLSYPFPMKSR